MGRSAGDLGVRGRTHIGGDLVDDTGEEIGRLAVYQAATNGEATPGRPQQNVAAVAGELPVDVQSQLALREVIDTGQMCPRIHRRRLRRRRRDQRRVVGVQYGRAEHPPIGLGPILQDKPTRAGAVLAEHGLHAIGTVH
jgi:hypothetical protein